LEDQIITEEGKSLRQINRWLEIVTKLCAYISAIMVILMSLVTTYGVIRRYVFQHADNNAFLVICIVMLFFAAFSWSEIQRQKRHIVVDYFSDKFKPSFKELLDNVISPVFGLIFCVVLLWKNISGALFSLQIGEKTLTNIPLLVFPLKLSIIIGVSLLCLVLILQIVTYIAIQMKRISGRKHQQA
jgi:TRAP-type mannitol/chloroaromatic compound transport system permease small subunit